MITKQVYTPYIEHARWHLGLGLFGLRMGGNGLSEMAKYSSFFSGLKKIPSFFAHCEFSPTLTGPTHFYLKVLLQ